MLKIMMQNDFFGLTKVHEISFKQKKIKNKISGKFQNPFFIILTFQAVVREALNSNKQAC